MNATILALLSLSVLAHAAQPAFPGPTEREHWTAAWISHPTAPLREPGVFHFRKVMPLTAAPSHFIVQVSADNHFVLYVNGVRIGDGPAKSDLSHWHYETFDLAPALHQGDNVLAATVWNFGIYAPLAVISDRTAFLLQGDTAEESAADTNTTWQVEQEPGQAFIPRVGNGFMFYWAADPGERLDAQLYDWGWKDEGSSPSSHWVTAASAMRETIYPNDDIALPFGRDAHNRWVMTRDRLPPMAFTVTSPGRVVRTNLLDGSQFPAHPVEVPPHTEAEVLIDGGEMVTGYPELTVSGGSGAHISIGYTEALYDSHHRRGNRNEVADRQVLGQFDQFLPDGEPDRTFTPLWFRTWRYLQLKIATGDRPLHLDAFHVNYTAFPFVSRATFTSSDPALGKIWQICWRTARLGAHDTYMDTPFWEQLQYIDDTRIQSLISYTVPGDGRLAIQALHAFDESRVPEGLTQSRYPSSLQQFIPNFSLSYVEMLHDYWMYRPDDGVVRELVPGTRPIFQWFLARQNEDGFLQQLPYDFDRMNRNGGSALITLMLVDALRQGAELEDVYGDKHLAAEYRAAANRAAHAVYHRCWNPQLGLLTDYPQQNSYSQYVNVYGVLSDAIPKVDQPRVIRTIIAANLGETPVTSIRSVDYHAQFYLAQAIDKAGLGEEYLRTIEPWRQMLAKGLTTTPEVADPSRSDTHAWSAHPIYDMLTIVAGIHPSAPGFAAVQISPKPGALDYFTASMPHEQQMITIIYRRQADKAGFTVTLPDHLPGVFVWNGKRYPLHSGEQSLLLSAAPSSTATHSQ